VQILSEDGKPLPSNHEGLVALKLPLPPGCLSTLWKNDQGYIDSYLSQFKGYYIAGDSGYFDQDGYFYIMGRVDDVINVSGHRLSTGEMEEIVASHPAIAECAVVGIHDELRGQIPVGLVVLKDRFELEEDNLEKDLIALIRHQIGAVAVFKHVVLVKRLPKTRSGKILRKTIRNIADGANFQIPSTIDDPLIIDEIKEAFRNRKIGDAFMN
jgi:acyl-coenzyme A synthetase/AMP-(fatty) acid ligase